MLKVHFYMLYSILFHKLLYSFESGRECLSTFAAIVCRIFKCMISNLGYKIDVRFYPLLIQSFMGLCLPLPQILIIDKYRAETYRDKIPQHFQNINYSILTYEHMRKAGNKVHYNSKKQII